MTENKMVVNAEKLHEIREWYRKLHVHAVANYTNGWDFFVEGVSLRDFIDEVRSYYMQDYDRAFAVYSDFARNRSEWQRDMREA